MNSVKYKGMREAGIALTLAAKAWDETMRYLVQATRELGEGLEEFRTEWERLMVQDETGDAAVAGTAAE